MRCKKAGHLQWCHYYGRRLWSVRWDKRNVWAFCAGCHRFFDTTDHPSFSKWLINKIGQKEYDMLTLKRYNHFPHKIEALEAMKIKLQRELNDN